MKYTLPALPGGRPSADKPTHHHVDWCRRYNAAARARREAMLAAEVAYEASKREIDAEVSS